MKQLKTYEMWCETAAQYRVNMDTYAALSIPCERELLLLRFQVFTAPSMKMAVFCDVVSCSLMGIYRNLIGNDCLHNQGLLLWNVG
jgi:hypothetical protein